MALLMWFISIMLMLLIVYQFLPSVQLYVDDRVTFLKGPKRKWRDFVEDRNFHIPDDVQTKEGVAEYNLARKGNLWGSPSNDGPDKSLPFSCYWEGGLLHCRTQRKDPV